MFRIYIKMFAVIFLTFSHFAISGKKAFAEEKKVKRGVLALKKMQKKEEIKTPQQMQNQGKQNQPKPVEIKPLEAKPIEIKPVAVEVKNQPTYRKTFSPKAKENLYLGGALNLSHNVYNSAGRANENARQYINAIINEAKTAIKKLESEKSTIPNEIADKKAEITAKQIEIERWELLQKQQEVLLQTQALIDPLSPAVQQTLKDIANTRNEIQNLEQAKRNLEKEKQNLEFAFNSIPANIIKKQEEIAQARLSGDEIGKIQSSASSFNMNVSLLTGYVKTFDKFIIGGELGLDIGKTKIGSNNQNAISANSSYAIFLNSRFGYQVEAETTVYAGFGLKFQNFTLEYARGIFDEKEKQMIKSFTFLVGAEKEIAENLSIFVELSHSSSLNKARFEITKQNLEFKAIEAKVGVRYFIPTTLFN